ncbi:response regulator [Megasphaera sueciensis]|uniref:response regulator n=1 Tax=Megasphaera sueciensis TaxID=349094 RepID=UPI003D014A54
MIHVLIIEDDPMVAEINKTFLMKIQGFSLVGSVNNGVDAMSFLKKKSNNVDLILLDVFMPQMDGIAFLEKVKREYNHIDVIMVTAAQSAKDVKFALSHGVVDYIIKPFTFERMALALNTYKNRIEILNASISIEQSTLDKKIFPKNQSANFCPKGIDKQTLLSVKQIVASQEGMFSIKKLTTQTRISRISLKKYLNYLEEQGVIKGTLQYRAVGRPVLMYQYMFNNKEK